MGIVVAFDPYAGRYHVELADGVRPALLRDRDKGRVGAQSREQSSIFDVQNCYTYRRILTGISHTQEMKMCLQDWQFPPFAAGVS